jgi:hypothetical protein
MYRIIGCYNGNMQMIREILFWTHHLKRLKKEVVRNKSIILLVGMVNSVHFARFVEKNCISNEQDIFVIVNSTPYSLPHPIIEEALRNKKVYYFFHRRFLVDNTISKIKPNLSRFILKIFGKKLEKSFLSGFERRNFENFLNYHANTRIIHLFEMQHAGYLYLEYIQRIDKKIKVYYTNYGSDVAYFKQFPAHNAKIREFLSHVDLYFAECNRDIAIVKDLGFDGECGPINMNSEINLNRHLGVNRTKSKPSQRKVISVKSYDSFVGRSNIILDAILESSQILKGYKIVFFSSSYYFNKVIAEPQLTDHEIKFEIFNHGSLSENDMINIFKQSRLILSNSKCDGVSTSIIEAAIHGAYPITSNTGCAGDWVDLTSDNLFEWDDKGRLKENILKAITNDKIVDQFYEKEVPKLIQRIETKSKIFESHNIYNLLKS